MSFQYYDLEREIADYLQPLLSDIAFVIELPENQAAFKRSMEKAVVVVAFAGSDFEPAGTNDTTYQLENISILCNVTSTTLRDETGIHNVIKELKQKLQGYSPANVSGRLSLKSIQYDDRNQETAIFSYNVEFTCRKLQVQEITAAADPVFKSGIIRDKFKI